MANIIKEDTEIKVGEVYYIDTNKIVTNKIAFYEKITYHFVLYDDDSGSLTVTRKKISKKTFEKLKKTLDKIK